MASSLMHLVISEGLLGKIARPDLFRLGCVLPDADGSPGHNRAVTEDGACKYYDLAAFRAAHPGLVDGDDLALGYYMHLVQDMAYRQFLYVEQHWDSSNPENVRRLHEDYRRLNPALVRRYMLVNDLVLPEGLSHPLIGVRAAAFLENLRREFLPYPSDEPAFFLTYEMANQFIDRALLMCRQELEALRRGESCLDPMAFAVPFGVRIRALRPEEYPLMDDFLYEAIFQQEGQPRLPREITSRPELKCYVQDFGLKRGDYGLCAEEKGRIIGMVWTRIIPGYGHLDDETPEFAISLRPEARGRGTGGRMMRAMLTLLRKEGWTRASLAVQKDNYALRMYQKAGFAIIGETKEEYLMRIDLNASANPPADE